MEVWRPRRRPSRSEVTSPGEVIKDQYSRNAIGWFIDCWDLSLRLPASMLVCGLDASDTNTRTLEKTNGRRLAIKPTHRSESSRWPAWVVLSARASGEAEPGGRFRNCFIIVMASSGDHVTRLNGLMRTRVSVAISSSGQLAKRSVRSNAMLSE